MAMMLERQPGESLHLQGSSRGAHLLLEGDDSLELVHLAWESGKPQGCVWSEQGESMMCTEMHFRTECWSRPRRRVNSLLLRMSWDVVTKYPSPWAQRRDSAARWVEALCGHYSLCSWPLLRPHFRLIEALLAPGL